jgi:hypothetical protein
MVKGVELEPFTGRVGSQVLISSVARTDESALSRTGVFCPILPYSPDSTERGAYSPDVLSMAPEPSAGSVSLLSALLPLV